MIERIEPSAVFCLLPRRAKDFSRSFEEVGRTGFWGRVSGRGGALHGGRFTTKQPRESTFGIRNRAGAKTVLPVPEAETA